MENLSMRSRLGGVSSGAYQERKYQWDNYSLHDFTFNTKNLTRY
jgi:hypothetical protein